MSLHLSKPGILDLSGGDKNDMKYIFHLQLEALVVEMQDPKTGVKGSEQKLNVTTIPHVITGENNTHLNTHQEKRKNKTNHKYK